mgnify:CR=1 FL=1
MKFKEQSSVFITESESFAKVLLEQSLQAAEKVKKLIEFNKDIGDLKIWLELANQTLPILEP